MPATGDAPSHCVFCALRDSGRTILSNSLACAVRDTTPVTHLHTLILPKRHAPTYFDMTEEEQCDVFRLLGPIRDEILHQDMTVRGFNIGINIGETAGQTIFHCHVHLIPRRRGDVTNPRGGVRAIIPGKADY